MDAGGTLRRSGGTGSEDIEGLPHMPRGRYSLHDPHDHTPSAKNTSTAHRDPRAGATSPRSPLPPASTPAPSTSRSTSSAVPSVSNCTPRAGGCAPPHSKASPGSVPTPPATKPPKAMSPPTPSPVLPPLSSSRSPACSASLPRPRDPRPPRGLHGSCTGPRTVDQSWALLRSEAHATDNGPLTVDEYQVSALDTGEQHTVHISGDVVLAAPGIELEDLETPPSALS